MKEPVLEIRALDAGDVAAFRRIRMKAVLRLDA